MDLFNQECDLLAQVEAIEIDNCQRISKEDREYCEAIQALCHGTLQQLHDTYEQMMESLKPLVESGFIVLKYNEKYEFYKAEWYMTTEEKYKASQYIPGLQEHTVRKLFRITCRTFVHDIIEHFNSKYGIEVKIPDTYTETLTPDKFDPSERPQYNELVDIVIAHLGGRSFAQAMEDEIYENALPKYMKERVTVKGNILSIEHYAHSCMYDFDLSSTTIQNLTFFIDALHYFFTGLKCRQNPNEFFGQYRELKQGMKYECPIPEVEYFRFYKNDKMEVRFKKPHMADEFYKKIIKEN